MKLLLGFICFIVLLSTIGGTAVYAQVSLGSEVDPLKFIIEPEVPGPNEPVTIEAQGVGSFLGNATVTWKVNGKTVLTGVGERLLSFTTEGLGAQSLVEIVIDSPERGTITRSFYFIPSIVNLIWEADTTVPPFFSGKALYSAGSRLTVTAFPIVIANKKTISSNNFSFQWSRNGSVVADQSGLGRTSISFNGDQLLAKERIAVDVYFEDVLVGRGSVTIPTVKPTIALYYRDPLQGIIYDQALTDFNLTAETSLQAQPYYFSNTSAANNKLAFTWTINGSETTGPNTAQGLITLRQTGSGSGENSVKVKVQNLDADKFIQSAQIALRILFGQQTNSGSQLLFGL